MNKYSLAVRQISSIAFAASLFISLSYNAFGQIGGQIALSSEKLPVNNFRTSDKDSSAGSERPRVVATSNQDDEAGKPVIVANSGQLSANSAALISGIEHLAFDILNQKRSENGLPVLRWSDEMAKIGRIHSQEMAQYNYFSHSGRNGSMVSDRADTLGISNWSAIGENIAFNRGVSKPAEQACINWMESPSHRGNILNTRWKDAGIGVALAADGSYYFTEVFIVR